MAELGGEKMSIIAMPNKRISVISSSLILEKQLLRRIEMRIHQLLAMHISDLQKEEMSICIDNGDPGTTK